MGALAPGTEEPQQQYAERNLENASDERNLGRVNPVGSATKAITGQSGEEPCRADNGETDAIIVGPMRKPSDRARVWNRIHARCSNRRRLVSKEKLRSVRRRQSTRSVRTGPGVPQRRSGPYRGYADRPTIECPEVFCLEENFDGVVDVLHRIRSQSKRQRNERTYIDLRQIRHLSPSAALVLAAELHRWNILRPKNRLRTIDAEEWDAKIRRLLEDMGFFELLHVRLPSANEAECEDETRYVRFRSDRKADGEAISRLRTEDLEPIVGAIPRRQDLYAAVTEAMTNVVQHAYPEGGKPANSARWWLSASRNAATAQVSIMIYDQGAGIPETLPRRFGERLRGLALSDHAQMIAAAHELMRTSTDEPHRGHGLERDIRGYLKVLDRPATYRVISLKGEYVYERKTDGQGKPTLKPHSKPLNGTLIEWRLTLR